MHSTEILRTDSFEFQVDGEPVTHADYFQSFTKTRRLGLLAPNRIDGFGAINLLMAHVTAFYDRYREDGGKFFAYPDFFAFQPAPPLAEYAMCDIWPGHKLVASGTAPSDVLQSITDRGVNILIVPDAEPEQHELEVVALESARRNIDRCYAYAFDGAVDRADVVIRCASSPLDEWAEAALRTLGDQPELLEHAQAWLDRCRADEILEQSYRRIDLDEALARMCGSSEIAAR
jgi:hypothetical protein